MGSHRRRQILLKERRTIASSASRRRRLFQVGGGLTHFDRAASPVSADAGKVEALEILQERLVSSLLVSVGFLILIGLLPARESAKVCLRCNTGFIFVQYLRVFFRPFLPLEICFLSTPRQMPQTHDHKYSPLPSADFDSSEVLVSFSKFIFT